MPTLNKFDPSKTMYLRGFDGRGASAAMHSATSSGFTVSGTFRDPADFAVLVIFDVDDYYNHPRFKPLPDFALDGVVLEFDVEYSGLAPLDCPKYPTIDWAFLDYILENGSSGRVDLSFANTQSTLLGISSTLMANTNATAVTSGTHSTASAVASVQCSSANAGDVLTLWFENFAFSYAMVGGDNPNFVAAQLAAAVNAYSYSGNTYGLSATSSGADITITASRPGADANMIRLYWFSTAPSRCSFAQASPIQLSGGSSSVTFHVKLDFTSLGLTSVRQLWLTFAPQLADSATYESTNWDAVFSNWSITADPNGRIPLQVAGPNSVRIEETDAWCSFNGTTWSSTNAAGWFSKGFAEVSSNPGDSITVTYWCQETHDLWVGTSLYSDRGMFHVEVDGVAQADLDMYLGDTADVPINTRRKVASNLGPGKHICTLTVSASNNSSSSGHYSYFDFLEAAVPSDVPAPLGPFSNRSPAIDYDTNHGYQLPAARLLWMFDQLGFTGPMNEYAGVFWLDQRTVTGQTLASATVTFNSGFVAGDAIFLDIAGTTIGKSVFAGETPAVWAEHFALFINETFSGVWASASGAVLTITCRSAAAAYQFTFSTSVTSTSGTLSVSGNLNSSVAGTWVIDPTQTPALNYGAAAWHADLYSEVYIRGNQIFTSLSMECVDTPDNPPSDVWVCRFSDGSAVLTDTGFDELRSAQCVPMAPSFLAYRKAQYLYLAQLQNAAGLTPSLQFGENLWWYFARLWLQPIGYISFTNPISVGMANPHGLSSGDYVVIANVEGTTSANGVWQVTVTDATHFTIPVSANAAWVVGTGTLSGGGMAFYDDFTTAAASGALGRALYPFYGPTDDPSVNSYADANFLAGQLAAHVAAIISYVQATYPSAVFEVLFPEDVNGPAPTPVSVVGGRLNAYINFPSSWQSHATAPFDWLKIEALAFITSDRDLELVKAALTRVAALSWPKSKLRYVFPWDNPGCAFDKEYKLALAAGFSSFTPWAFDHINLLGWDPTPEPAAVMAQIP